MNSASTCGALMSTGCCVSEVFVDQAYSNSVKQACGSQNGYARSALGSLRGSYCAPGLACWYLELYSPSSPKNMLMNTPPPPLARSRPSASTQDWPRLPAAH